MPRTITHPLLPFKAADRWFAIPIDLVEGVAPLPKATAIPGNQSRTIRGLSYLFGQLMALIDVAPLMNLGSSRGARMVVVIRQGGAYYAIMASELDQLIARPTIVPYKRPLFDFTLHYVDRKGTKITLIDTEKLVTQHLCR